METLSYTVIPALYQSEGGPEAQVGDQVKLYLDTDAQPGFPEFITGIIQHPIVRVCDGTQYSVEYDPVDLEGAAELLVTGDVVSALVVSAVDLLRDYVDDTFALKTRTVNGQPLSANVTLDHDDVGAAAASHTHVTADISDASDRSLPLSAAVWSTRVFVSGLTGDAAQFNGWYEIKADTEVNNALVWEHLDSNGDATFSFTGSVWQLASASILSGNIATAFSGGFAYPWNVDVWTMANVAYGTMIVLSTDIGDFRDPELGLDLKTRAVTSRVDGVPDKLVATTPVVFPHYTVATLPAAASYPYGRAFVTDCVESLLLNFCQSGFSGGGTNKVPVYSDGTQWIIG